MLSAKEQSLLDALEPRAEQEGIEIVTIEIVGSRKAPTIRVYLDTPHGIVFDDIAAAQSWINDIVDEIDPFPGAYTLEVSSPGIDRPLRTPKHFADHAGEEAVVMTTEPIDGRAKFSGTLEGFDDDAQDVLMDIDGNKVSIPYRTIKKAHIKGVVSFK
jgi:ribosome maturation factor RimP